MLFQFIPYYTMITPLIILGIIRKEKRINDNRLEMMLNIRNERELYFSSYSQLWNNKVWALTGREQTKRQAGMDFS